MLSEKEIRQFKSAIDGMVETYELINLKQLSDSESKQMRKIVERKYPDLVRLGSESMLEPLMYKEYKLRMSEQDKSIYECGVAHGRKSALDFVLGDIDDMFSYD